MDDVRPAKVYDEADERLRKAERDFQVQQDVVRTFREQLVSAVRERRAAAARVKLDEARRAYDEAAEGMVRFFSYHDELQKAAQAERTAAAELANALREGAPLGYESATGGKYISAASVNAVEVVVVDALNRHAHDSADALSEHLRRRIANVDAEAGGSGPGRTA